MLALLLSCGGRLAMAQEADKPAPQDEKTVVKVEEEAKKEKTPVAKLRGKLLYKKSQIKKLEKAAAAADAVLAEKLQELENQRRALLTSAEPRLAGLYAEHDEMEGEIQKMTERK
jgi:small-conductance mechanosensitive channel